MIRRMELGSIALKPSRGAAEGQAYAAADGGEIMNVGSGGTYSVNTLAEIIGGPTTSLPKRPGEPDCTFADIDKIQRLLEWSPQVSFEVGVGKVLGVIDEWADAPVWTPEGIADATRAWFEHLDSRARI